MTDEQESKEQVRNKAQEWISKGRMPIICNAMIESRRLYTVASAALESELASDPDMQLLVEYITGAARQEAEKDFTMKDLFCSLSYGIMPWLFEEIVDSTFMNQSTAQITGTETTTRIIGVGDE